VQSSAMGIGAMATTMNLNKKKKEVWGWFGCQI
jgi:hypothetical protein